MTELKHPERFEEFWSAFPRKRAKLAALKAYARALKITTAAKILDGAKRYAVDRRGMDETFTKHAATWLNAGCWADYDTDLTVIPGEPRGAMVTIRVYVPFHKRDAWDQWGRAHGKTYPRDRHGGWWFPAPAPPEGQDKPLAAQ